MAKNMYQKRKERKENKKNKTYEEKKTNINWYPGHMVKTKREIQDILNTIDIVIEVVDARIPISSYIKDIENIIKNKKVIIVFNKYDLCDKEKTNLIAKKYDKFEVVMCDSKNSNDYKKIITICQKLMESENKQRKEKGMLPKKAKCLVIGVPNVGKSTLINKMSNKKVANVANKPGVTKNLNIIKINDKIDLIDTPGILWPKIEHDEVALNLGSMGIIKEEILPMDKISIHILNKLNENYKNILKKEFGLDSFDVNDIENSYEIISKYKKINYSKGEIDYEKISLLIYNSIKSEKIKEITFDKLSDL